MHWSTPTSRYPVKHWQCPWRHSELLTWARQACVFSSQASPSVTTEVRNRRLTKKKKKFNLHYNGSIHILGYLSLFSAIYKRNDVLRSCILSFILCCSLSNILHTFSVFPVFSGECHTYLRYFLCSP